MLIEFIGDVHSKHYVLEHMDLPHVTFQVGDMGLGFYEPSDAILHKLIKEKSIHFIRGNHDNLTECQKNKLYLDDGFSYKLDNAVLFFCGGAKSIDQHLRREGVDWWSDEELEYSEMQTVIDKYARVKPDIMVTHDCPQSIAELFFGIPGDDKSATRQGLQAMLDIHNPKYWIFGHWHKSINQIIGDTTFICLDELDRVQINTNLIKRGFNHG